MFRDPRQSTFNREVKLRRKPSQPAAWRATRVSVGVSPWHDRPGREAAPSPDSPRTLTRRRSSRRGS